MRPNGCAERHLLTERSGRHVAAGIGVTWARGFICIRLKEHQYRAQERPGTRPPRRSRLLRLCFRVEAAPRTSPVNGECPGRALPSEETPAHRWLANAEPDHGGAILLRRAVAHQLGAGAAAAKGVDARGPRRRRWCPAGQGRCSGGWRRTRPQTEPAESEERDPPTGPARHRPMARETSARHEASSQ